MTPEAGRPEVERHWLVFNHGREVTGCHCGFDPDDYGWGDSVVDHLLALAAAPPQPDQTVTATVEAEFERGVRQAMTWLRADYPYGEGPDWREHGTEWIADRLAEHTAAVADALGTAGEAGS